MTAYELLAVAGLLLIPYLTRNSDNAMASFGRFASVCLPVYIVIGWLLSKTALLVRTMLGVVAGFYLGAYAGLYGALHRFI